MIVADIEASGIDNRVHGILSIGAVDFLDPDRKFYGECRIWDGAHVMDEALDVNGFSYEEIKSPEKQSEEELMEDFREWLHASENHTIAGQNPHFDSSFLNMAAERSGIDLGLAHRLIDLHSICFFHMVVMGIEPPVSKKRTELNSDTIMRYVGIPVEPRPHNALNGALWEAEAFSRLLYEEPLFEDFEEYAIPWA